MSLLEGKCALVTGGTTGLGLAVAVRFLREGAQVVITGRDRDLGERAERTLGAGARFVAADAADPAAVAASVRVAADHLGGLDVLVNNAGVGVTARLVDTPLADYDRVMSVNVRGYLLYAQHAYPHLARRRGSMIHVASDAGIWGEQATGLYSVTKAAVVMLGKMLALDGGPDGVRSNVLCPGDIWPGMRHMAPPGERGRAEDAGGWPVPPIGRIGQAGDVAAAAVFYASDQAEFITGTTLLVDGGMTAGYLQRERREHSGAMAVSRQWVADMLRHMGYARAADEAVRELPDPVEHEQLEEFGNRHGISRDELNSRMGGSP